MKKIINIKRINKKSTIYVQEGSIIKHLRKEANTNNKLFIVVDSKIKKIIDKVKLNKNIYVIKIKGSESIKSIDSYWKTILMLLKLKVDRNSTLIAIGGGTVGDLVGFIASTVLRGVRFILMPTTLLSQVDSSIGGKNGINTIYGKNLVGTFLQPDKVVIDPSVLKSLTLREIKSGYAEILKYALINNKSFYSWLNKNYNKILNLNKPFINKAIIKSIDIKSKYIQLDEKEKLINSSSRAILNFGHTFGHALETISMSKDYKKITHGEAISIGMAVALKISYKMKKISKLEYQNIISHLKKVGLPHSDELIYNKKIMTLIMSDKKNSNNMINLILLKKIGRAYFERDLNIKKIKTFLN